MLLKTVFVFGSLISVQNVIGKPSGRTVLKMPTRIIGGNDTNPNEFPFMVELYLDEKPQCGGAIISENYVVTAAHCTNGYEDHIMVVAGDHNLDRDDTTEQNRTAVSVTEHKDYDKHEHFNDISLVKVDVPFEFNEYVKPIALPEPSYVVSGKATIIGWGLTSKVEKKKKEKDPKSADPKGSAKLQKIELPIANHKTCKENYKKLTVYDPEQGPVHYINITKNQICAGYFDREGKDACHGDSGGPLIARNKANWVLAGITSFGADCAIMKYPGIYTEVAKYTKWIAEHVDKSDKTKLKFLKN